MPDRKDQRSRAARDAGGQQPVQEATIAREQAGRSSAGHVKRTLKEEKGKKPTVTLQDGSIVETYQAVIHLDLLKDCQRHAPEAFKLLLAMTQGRPLAEADAGHLKILVSSYGFLNEDYSIDPLTRAVLLNSYSVADGDPMIGALQLRSEADKAVLEEARAQHHQDLSEDAARARKTGGWLDQLWEKMEQQRRERERGH